MKVVRAMWEPGESGDIESWIKRVHAVEANFNTGMARFNLRVAQLEHEIKTVQLEPRATGAVGGAEDSEQ